MYIFKSLSRRNAHGPNSKRTSIYQKRFEKVGWFLLSETFVESGLNENPYEWENMNYDFAT